MEAGEVVGDIVLIQMECGRPDRHAESCDLQRRSLKAWKARRWEEYYELLPQVLHRRCGCAKPGDVDRKCRFSGPVDVEVNGERRGSWVCPRCQAAHTDEEV